MTLDGNAVVLKTTNGGNFWRRVYRTSRTGEWCWKISPATRGLWYVSIERESGFSSLLKTFNYGEYWYEIPFVNNYVEQGIGFINGNTGWLGGWSYPTYETTNGGANWYQVGWGVWLNRFRFLSDTLAYAVGYKVYKYSIESVGINLISSQIPFSIQLYQNYPNPFNPVTKIKFDLTQDARGKTPDVKLLVYDALGKEVATLVKQKQNAGSYEVEFDGSNFSSGIYFYKLELENFNEVKSMILLK